MVLPFSRALLSAGNSMAARIAIIAILAAMLLPALNKARDKARTINCISNLKQCGQFELLYQNDFGMYFASHNATTDNITNGQLSSKGWIWTRFLVEAGYAPAFSSAFRCPTNAAQCDLDTSATSSMFYSYGGFYLNYSATLFAFDLKHSNIQKTGYSKVVMIADSGQIPSGRSYAKMLVSNATGSYSRIYPQHDGRANLLFLDGHVSGAEKAQIKQEYKALSYSQGVQDFNYFCVGPYGDTIMSNQ